MATAGAELLQLILDAVLDGSLAFSVSFWPTSNVALFLFSVTLAGAFFTVTFRVAFLPLCVLTVMVVEPAFTPVTTPEALTVATLSSLET